MQVLGSGSFGGLALCASGLSSAMLLPDDGYAVKLPVPGLPDAPRASPARVAAPAPREDGAAGGGNSSRLRKCQIPGCTSAPAEPRSYAGRCRLCVTHMRADTVQLGAQLLRFCQKCNRLQALAEFEGAKHTCRARLLEHNERRRNTRAAPEACAEDTPEHRQARRAAVEAALRAGGRGRARDSSAQSSGDAGPAPPRRETSPLQAALQNGLFDLGDWLADELVSDEGTGTGTGADSAGGPASDSSGMWGAPANGALPAATAAFAAAWPEAARGEAGCEGADSGAAYALFLAGAAAAASAVAAELRGRRLHVKLLAAAAPAAASADDTASLQPPAALQPLPASLAHLFADARVADAPLLEALGVAVRPGCMLLTFEAVQPAEAGADATAAELLRRALRTPGAAGDFLRAQPKLLVSDAAGGEATAQRRGGDSDALAPLSLADMMEARDVAMAPPTPPVGPMALLLPSGEAGDAEGAVTLQFEAPLPEGAAVHCRMAGGAVLAVSRDAAGGAVLSLRPAGAGGARLAEGCALVEVLPAGVPLHRAGEPRPLLLTADAAVAAEVAAAGAAARGAPATRAHVDRAVSALGAALAPGATSRVVAAAATAALWMGWPAALRALLAKPALGDGSAAAHGRLLTLLSHAAAAGRPDMLAALCAGAPPLADGGALTAELLHAARAEGHARAELAVAAAQDALQTRSGAAADAQPAAAAAAGKLLAAAAAALEAAKARSVARSAAAAAARDDIVAAAAAAAVAHAADDDGDARALRAIHSSPSNSDDEFAAAAPAAHVERALYDAECAAAYAPIARMYLFLVLSLDVVSMLRRIELRRRGPIPPDRLASMGVMTVDEIMRAHFYHRSWSFLPSTLALLALLAGPPAGRLRRFYVQHATALLAAHWLVHFVISHVAFELHLRRWLAVPVSAALLPSWWTVGQLNITASATIAPLPARWVAALLALRAVLMFAPVSWTLWPQGLPLFGTLTQARANATFTIAVAVVLLTQEQRHFSAWRLARAAVRAAKAA